MDPYRFYVPGLREMLPPHPDGEVELPDDQAHHARTVLRLEGGEPVILFDGKGAWARGTVQGPIPKKHPLTICLERDAENLLGIVVDPRPAIRLTIASAVPKGERAEWLVDQASQLNVSRLQWLACDRSVVKPREGGQKIEKWRRLAIESAKQCHRTWLMEIEQPLELDRFLQSLQTTPPLPTAPRILWLDPRGAAPLASAITPPASDLVALVGPEGGWSPREESLLGALADAGKIARIKLTPTILRIETACTALAAVIGTLT